MLTDVCVSPLPLTTSARGVELLQLALQALPRAVLGVVVVATRELPAGCRDTPHARAVRSSSSLSLRAWMRLGAKVGMPRLL